MLTPRCFTLALLSVVLSLPVVAAVRPSHGELLDNSRIQLVDALSNVESPFPPALVHRGDIYVLFECGATHARVTALAPERTRPEHLAQGLEMALRASGLDGPTVEFCSEHNYSVASTSIGHTFLGSRHAATDLPVGSILTGLRSAGYKPYAVLRVMKTAHAGQLPTPWKVARYSRLYDVNAWPSGAVVWTSTDLSGWQLCLTLAVFAVLPGIILLATLIGIGAALWPGIPPDRRRRLFTAAGNKLALPLMLVDWMAVIGYIHSATARSIADLWFGQFSAENTVSYIGYGLCGAMFVLLLPLAYLEVRLFRGGEVKKRPKPVASHAEKVSGRWTYAGCGAQVLGVILSVVVTNGVFGWKPDGPLWIAAPLVLMIGAPLICILVARDFAKSTKKVSEELTARAAELAQRIGAPARDVRIDESTTGQRNPNALMLPNGRIRVTRLLVDTLEPAEMDWVLAHELAHSRRSHWRRAWWLLLLVPMAYFPLLTTTLGRNLWDGAPWLPLALFGLPVVALILSHFFIQPRMRGHEYDADRDALAATGDLSAALSALSKMAVNSYMPYMHDMDDMPSHPKLSKRLDALRKAAREMGLHVEISEEECEPAEQGAAK